jgi:alkaline phosphatase D
VIQIDRRALIQVGLWGIGALTLPGGAATAQAILGWTGFTHGIASGEPAPDSMLLWTRYKPPSGGPARVSVELSRTADFAKIAGGAVMTTGPWRDHTVKLTVDGLEPATRYYYRFVAPDGSLSPIGRTKTLPLGKVGRFSAAVFSCANVGWGEFNAYGHAAARDLDLWLHQGDYIYEPQRGGYDDHAAFAERILPINELVTLADYRLRYAVYRSDPQLQTLHAAAPMIPMADDHETANDSWEGGAAAHHPDEGDWVNRKLAAMQVWREWLPVGEAPWAIYPIGDLASYYRTDTRTSARSKQWDYREIERGDVQRALREFRDVVWQDPAATMMGTEQESWLYHALARDKATWQLIGVGTNIGYNSTPVDALNWLSPDATESNKSYFKQGIAAGEAGMPYNLDNWGGYPAAKRRLLAAAQRGNANLIALTGDSHNAWAFDLKNDGRAAGVEFGGTSVTCPGMERSFKGTDPAVIARTIVGRNPEELRWMDPANRGYMYLTLTPGLATNEFVFMDTVQRVSPAVRYSHRVSVRPGRNEMEPA